MSSRARRLCPSAAWKADWRRQHPHKYNGVAWARRRHVDLRAGSLADKRRGRFAFPHTLARVSGGAWLIEERNGERRRRNWPRQWIPGAGDPLACGYLTWQGASGKRPGTGART